MPFGKLGNAPEKCILVKYLFACGDRIVGRRKGPKEEEEKEKKEKERLCQPTSLPSFPGRSVCL